MLDTVIDIAKGAGEILMKYYKTDYEVIKKSENIWDVLTPADPEAEEYIKKRLQEEFPEDDFLGEEEETAVDYSKRVWICDPLDGTRIFAEKKPGFSVSIGLVENGRPILGVIYAPALGELFYAEKGKGAFMEKDGKKEKLQVSTRKSIAEAIAFADLKNINTSKPMHNLRAALEPKEFKYEFIGMALILCRVAQGVFDISLHHREGKWDAAGGEIILLEAGGMLTDKDGDIFDYTQEERYFNNRGIVTNGSLHEEVLKFVQEHHGTFYD